MSGVRGNKAGRPARITPRDLCRVVNPRRQPVAGDGLASHSIGTEMNNSSYLDKPLVPLAVALRSMLAETEAKIAAAEPSEKEDLQRRAEVLREWLTPQSTAPLST